MTEPSEPMAVDSHSILFEIPEDMLIDLVMARLPCDYIGLCASCCRRIATIVTDERLWYRLAARDLGSKLLFLTQTTSWRKLYKELFCLKSMEWRAINREQDQKWPIARWGHSVVVLNTNSFLVFGGEGNGALNDVFQFDCSKMTWQEISCQGVYPEKRFGHSCVVYQDRHAIIFGGSNGQQYYDDLHCLDVKTWSFWKPETEGEGPSSRSSHSMSIIGDCAYVFGGVGGGDGPFRFPTTLPADFWKLDFSQTPWKWSRLEVKGTIPSARFVHRVVTIDNKIFLFGGRTLTPQKFNDLHSFDTSNMTWTKHDDVVGTIPSPRGGCTLLAIGRKIIAFCGRAARDVCLYDGVYILDTRAQPMRWSQVRTDSVSF
mmetsp:Transcript_50733/g.158499  ORF Transcript_50733/g.158499 Transcript_50733/m.158499 type:complete len:373 (+) Transcript_50733:65-1183(+)